MRAALEGIALNTRDVLDAMARDTGRPIESIKVDGGASANGFLMQALADITGAEVRVAAVQETTALGAAFMAGIAAGVWRDRFRDERFRSPLGHTEVPFFSGRAGVHNEDNRGHAAASWRARCSKGSRTR